MKWPKAKRTKKQKDKHSSTKHYTEVGMIGYLPI